jgi:hypothetical protein
MATAAGPWKAQVVDAETKRPLEGVVVVAVWFRATRTFGGPSEEYYESQEILSDKDGWFTIAAQSFFSLNPLVFFRGPHFLIFKPGYGRGIWPGGRQREVWPEENLDSIVIEMPRLRTLEERRKYIGRVKVGFVDVPQNKTPLLEKAIAEERRAVGYGAGGGWPDGVRGGYGVAGVRATVATGSVPVS